MTDLDQASQKLIAIDKKTISVDEIDFDDLSVGSLEDIKKEIECVISFRKHLNDSKVSLCRKYIRNKDKLKETFEKDKSVLQQQHDNVMLNLRNEIKLLEDERVRVKSGKMRMKIDPVEEEEEDSSYEEDEDEDEDEIIKLPTQNPKKKARGRPKKAASNTKKGK